MSTCPHCGYVNPPGSAFCAQCRHAFAALQRRPQNLPQHPPAVRGYVQCPQCRTWSTEDEPTCIQCGHDFRLRYAPPRQPEQAPFAASTPGIFAILALAFGIMSWFMLACLFGPVAFVCGLIAWHQSRPEHRWMAGVGIIVGLLSLIYASITIDLLGRLAEPPPPAPTQQPQPLPPMSPPY